MSVISVIKSFVKSHENVIGMVNFMMIASAICIYELIASRDEVRKQDSAYIAGLALFAAWVVVMILGIILFNWNIVMYGSLFLLVSVIILAYKLARRIFLKDWF